MFNRQGRKYEITAPPADLASRLQHPPPALLIAPSSSSSAANSNSNQLYSHLNQRKDAHRDALSRKSPSARRQNGSTILADDSYRAPPRGKEKKKKGGLLSVFKKSRGKEKQSSASSEENDWKMAAAHRAKYSRSPGAVVRYPPKVPPVYEDILGAGRPQSASSDWDLRLHRRGSVRSARSGELFAGDEEEPEEDGRSYTDYPRFKCPPPIAPTVARSNTVSHPRPSAGKGHPPAARQSNTTPGKHKTDDTYDTLDPYQDPGKHRPAASGQDGTSRRDHLSRSLSENYRVHPLIGQKGSSATPGPMRILSIPASANESTDGVIKRTSAPKSIPADEPTHNTPSSASFFNYAPGLIGIKNHGNTCFMNSIIQCLSNTEHLLHYFLTNAYQVDLHKAITGSPVSTLTTNKAVAGNRAGTSPRVAHDSIVLGAEQKGAITEYTAFLLKSLWNGQYEGRVSAVFKELVGVWAEQYRGSNQHDAQEFLLWLLDHMHEDLNLATPLSPRKVEEKGHASQSDEEQAAETLAEHLRRHDSAVHRLFGAQYHSSLHCPECGSHSNTFDPYLCVSLSVPRRGIRPVYITMARKHQARTKLMMFGLSMKVTATVHDIQRQLAVEAHTLPHYLVVGDMKPDGFHRFFRPNDPISMISDHAQLFAFEVTPYRGEFPGAPLPYGMPGPGVLGGERSQEAVFIILQNKVGQGEYSRRFGTPLCLRVWRDCTYSQLQSVVFKGMKRHLKEGVNPEIDCRDYIFFRCRVVDGLQGQEYLDPYSSAPLMSPSVEKSLSQSRLWGYELHIKVVAEWDQWVKDCVCVEVTEMTPPVHSSAQMVKEHFATPLEASLDDCLQWHTREEKLDDMEDPWVCPFCCHSQPNATKKISFWSLPDVLVIHLKRFEQDEFSSSKLNTHINFPIKGLDLTSYLAPPQDPTRPSSSIGFNKTTTASTTLSSAHDGRKDDFSSRTLPLKSVHFEGDLKKSKHSSTHSSKIFIWKKNKKSRKPERSSKETSPDQNSALSSSKGGGILANRNHENSLYDLYAVCSHHGDMNRGHYTAHCLNPANTTWYTFDDHHVLPVYAEQQLVTQDAYILFYVRRSTKHRHQQETAKRATSTVANSDKGVANGDRGVANGNEGVGPEAHWIYHLPKYTLDLNSLGSLESLRMSPQRQQGLTTSAQELSSASGVSPPNASGVFFSPQHTSYPTQAASAVTSAALQHIVPTPPFHAQQQQQPQYSRGSSPGNMTSSPPNSVIYPQSLPSPGALSHPASLSQHVPTATQIQAALPRRRAGSFHGTTHYSTRSTNSHSATRV